MRGERLGIGVGSDGGTGSPRMVAPTVRQKSAMIRLRASIGSGRGLESTVTVLPRMARFRAEFPCRRGFTSGSPIGLPSLGDLE